jgi:hypothetical protein
MIQLHTLPEKQWKESTNTSAYRMSLQFSLTSQQRFIYKTLQDIDPQWRMVRLMQWAIWRMQNSKLSSTINCTYFTIFFVNAIQNLDSDSKEKAEYSWKNF